MAGNSIRSEVLVGRQPIYRRDLSIFGYELLFRDSRVNRADIADGEGATGRVILNTFLEIGLQNVVEEGHAFINFTRSLIVGEACTFLPKNRIVLEVLETVAADAEVVQALERLSAQGYVIALDDFAFRPELEPLVDLCQLVKLDVLALGHEGTREHVARLKPRGVQLLAEKI